MIRIIKKGAQVVRGGVSLGNLTTIKSKAESTDTKHKRNVYTMHVINLHCTFLHSILSRTSSITGNNLGGLLLQRRRLIATPFVAFSFCAVNRAHGVRASNCFDGHADWETLKGLLFPVLQSANLIGVAHPLGGVVSFTNN